MRYKHMNFHSPFLIAAKVGSIIEYDEIELPSGEKFYGGTEVVIGLRPGEIRVKKLGWLPVTGIKQILDGFTAGETDTRYESGDETVLALFERLEQTAERLRAMDRELDQARAHYDDVRAGRGITDKGADGRFIQPREKLLEVRRLEKELMIETGYHELAERSGRLDMLADMLRTAILMMPVNTPRGAAAKADTLVRHYDGCELDDGFVEKLRSILSELGTMGGAKSAENPMLVADIDFGSDATLGFVAERLRDTRDGVASLLEVGKFRADLGGGLWNPNDEGQKIEVIEHWFDRQISNCYAALEAFEPSTKQEAYDRAMRLIEWEAHCGGELEVIETLVKSAVSLPDQSVNSLSGRGA